MNVSERNAVIELTKNLATATNNFDDNNAGAFFVREVAFSICSKTGMLYKHAAQVASCISCEANIELESKEDRAAFTELAVVYADVIIKLSESMFSDKSLLDVEVMKNFARQTNLKLVL